jgi:hypothetical protein
MASNYPNMSYCMFQNTRMAMDQVNTFIMEADEDDCLGISDEELRAMEDLKGYCIQFLREVEFFEERRQEVLEEIEEEVE